MDNTQRRARIIASGSVLVLLLLFVALWARKRFADEPPPPMRPVPVLVIRPVRADLKESIVLPAVLESEYMVSVVPRVTGILTDVAVEEGQRVVEDEVLALVDPQPYELEFKAAESAWKLAESSLARIERMYESAGASLQRLEEARAKRDSALSSYQFARMRLSYAEVRSPVGGTVLRRTADPGNMASGREALFIVGDEDRLRVNVSVPEKYWDRFHRSESIKVVLRRGLGDDSQEVEAEILRMSPSIAPESKTFDVIGGPAGQTPWPIGSQLSVEFVLDERPGVWSLPVDTVAGGKSLWRIDEKSMTAVSSSLGETTVLDESIVVPEKWSDDLFVLRGQNRMKEGQNVLIVGEES